MSAFSSGSRLRDRYRLLDLLGAGGMSQVWRAVDELLDRPVAVKVLAAPLVTDPGLREATWREARAVARLSHPHLTQVHDYGEVALPAGGVAGYLVMELIEGQTLAARLASGPLPAPAAARVAGEVAAALAAAHRIGVVHRDIKPANVMLTESGVKVLDFGIAAMAGAAAPDDGRLAGTPTYAAPERLTPEAAAHPASDVFSLGVLLYEALAGRPPAHFDSWSQAASADRSGWPPPLPRTDVPDRIADICRDCLAPHPGDRPSARQVAAALAEAAAGNQAPPTVVQPAEPRRYAAGAAPLPAPMAATARAEATRVGGPIRRGGPLVALGAATAVVVAVLVAILLATAWRSGEAEPSPVATGERDQAATAGPTGSAETGVVTPSPSPSPSPAPDTGSDPTPAEVIAEFDRALITALEADALTRDGFDDLRDELDDLRDALAKDDPADRAKKLVNEAEDLLEEIEDLLDDGEIDQPTADHLAGLLAPLLAG